MTDQAVDTDGTRLSGGGRPRASATAPTESQFLGRTRELKELRADIERAGLDTIAGKKAPRARVLLIAGRPGSGRTALADELVRQVAHRYPDGVLRARLTEPDGTPVPTDRAARALLDAFGVPAPAGASADDLTADLREALTDRRVLLLLDGAADAEQVDELVPPTPSSLVLAVTEGPLTGVADVRPCTLGGLDTKSAVELLTRWTGSVRVTVDPLAAEGLVEECGAQPAALVLAGGWLAARPKSSVADLAKRLRARSEDGPVLARVFHHSYEALPAVAARILRLLSLTPGGLADPHTASALAGCSVSAARSTLDDFTALGLLRRVDSPLPQYEVPDCLVPLLRNLTETKDRPAEVQLARARMLERTVRLLQSCRAITQTDDALAQSRLAGLPRALRFPNPRAAADWLRIRRPALLAAARTAVADGELDTLARRLMAALTRALVAHEGTGAAAPDLYGIHALVLDVAERRDLPRERAAALLNLADLDARTGRTQDALVRYRAALDAGRQARDPYATGRAMESVGGAYQELGDWYRAADWYGRALAQRLARGEGEDAARLHGRIAGVQTYAGRYGDALRNWRSAVSGHRRTGDIPAVARALSELARVQEYAGRPDESLGTCHEAVEWARRADDARLQAALQLRLADTLDRLGDSSTAQLHRNAAERMLGEDPAGPDGYEYGGTGTGVATAGRTAGSTTVSAPGAGIGPDDPVTPHDGPDGPDSQDGLGVQVAVGAVGAAGGQGAPGGQAGQGVPQVLDVSDVPDAAHAPRASDAPQSLDASGASAASGTSDALAASGVQDGPDSGGTGSDGSRTSRDEQADPDDLGGPDDPVDLGGPVGPGGLVGPEPELLREPVAPTRAEAVPEPVARPGADGADSAPDSAPRPDARPAALVVEEPGAAPAAGGADQARPALDVSGPAAGAGAPGPAVAPDPGGAGPGEPETVERVGDAAAESVVVPLTPIAPAPEAEQRSGPTRRRSSRGGKPRGRS